MATATPPATPAQDHVAVTVGLPVQSPSKAQQAIDKIGVAPGFPTKCLAILVASIWVISAAAYVWVGYSYQAYAVAVGSVGLVFSLSALLLLKLNPEPLSKELFKVKDTAVTLQQLIALFMVLWWGVGAGVCTFIDPFTATTNGYFGVWGGFLASLLALADCYDVVREQVQKNMSAAKDTTESTSIKGTSVGLCAAAVVVLLACCRDVRNEAVFGLISSVVTILITIVFIFVKDIEEKQAKVVDAFVFCLLILWIATAGVLTFRYFILTGNGFFGSYAGAFFAFKLFGLRFLN